MITQKYNDKLIGGGEKMIKRIVIIGLVLLILVLSGCSNTQELLGKWEGYDTKEYIEFIDSKTLNWDGSVCDYEIKDKSLVVNYGIFQSVFEYNIEDGKLVLTQQEGNDYVFIKEGYLKNDASASEELVGEWGILYNPLFSFNEDGSILIKKLPETETVDSGSYTARNGIIRFESDSDLNHSIFLEYEFKSEELTLNYVGEEEIKLIRVDTDEIRDKAAEDYKNRFNSGRLYQEEIDNLSDNDRKEYINDNVLRYSSIDMIGPDETNYAMDIVIAAKNMSSRSIKYIYYTVLFINNVGDEIDNSLFGNVLTFTGPIEPGEIGGKDSYWPSVIFDSKRQIKEWVISEIKIEYIEGDKIILKGNDVSNDNSSVDVHNKNNETTEILITELFDKSFDEITKLYGYDFDSYEYAGSTFIDYREAGHNISIGFAVDSFSTSSKPSVLYSHDVKSFATSLGIEGELTPVTLFNAIGEPSSKGYDEMGETGFIVQYNLDGLAVNFVCDDEDSATKYIEMTKISFRGIEEYLTKTYSELIALFGEDCEVEKKDNGVVFLKLTNTKENIKIGFIDPSLNLESKPIDIIFTPNDSNTLYNGVTDGMMPEDIESILGVPTSNLYDERLGYILNYDYERFYVELYCDETYGLYGVRIKN